MPLSTFPQPGYLYFELVKAWPAVIVAIAVAYIAWKQYEVARAKFKLDLFEKRYEIFLKTWEHLTSVVRSDPGPTASSDFDNYIPKAGFLFGPDIEAYMKKISKNRIALWNMQLKTNSSSGILAPEDIPKHSEFSLWFIEEALNGAKNEFARYLDFSKWT